MFLVCDETAPHKASARGALVLFVARFSRSVDSASPALVSPGTKTDFENFRPALSTLRATWLLATGDPRSQRRVEPNHAPRKANRVRSANDVALGKICSRDKCGAAIDRS